MEVSTIRAELLAVREELTAVSSSQQDVYVIEKELDTIRDAHQHCSHKIRAQKDTIARLQEELQGGLDMGILM